MATNLERLKAKKASNQKKETNLSTSFSSDEGDYPGTIEKSDENTRILEAASKDVNNESTQASNDAEKPKSVTQPINPINPIIDNDAPKETVPTQKQSGSEKNIGLRLSTDEDKQYLDMAPLARSMTKKAFFIDLMEKEFDNDGKLSLNDPKLSAFRTSSLRTTAITISVPEELISDIKLHAAKHMMKYQRYVAYVISKARENDEMWNNMFG